MDSNKKLKLLREKEHLLKGKAEDIQEEIVFLTERIQLLLEEEVSNTKKINLIQIDIEELKR